MKRFPAILNGVSTSGSAAAALLAMWTVVASTASVSAAGAIEARAILSESTSVRTMVAVVTAVAREILGVEIAPATNRDVEPIRPPVYVYIAPVIDEDSLPGLRLPEERLLDLPPPVC